MSIDEVQAIDVHGHFGTYCRDNPLVDQWMTADAATVAARARAANTRLTVVSPLSGLLPRGEADAVAANDEAAKIIRETEGLLQWVIIHPHQRRTYEQAAEMLAQPQCVGIKIHPEEHVYPIRKYGADIFDFAARHDAVVLAHSGDPNSLPSDFIEFADAHSNVKLILAHLGNGGGAGGDPTLQVRAIQASRHGNVFVDTSSARSILAGLVEWAVKEIGSKKILYGTDTPLYFAASQRARIDQADISEEDRRAVLCENAERLLGV